MRDLFLVGFIAALVLAGFKRPFLWVLLYAYIDIVSPQRLSYFLLNAIPISQIVFALALAGWLVADARRSAMPAPRQWLLLILLTYCGLMTLNADFPVEAASKWDWVSKALIFAIFLPFTLTTRLRLEALLLFMTLSASAIVVTGGIKTVLSGGGYGALRLMVDNNSGLYESSTISAVAIALIPIILWLMRHGTIFPPDGRVRTYGWALIFACLLIPVGTQARTGLVCIGVLALLQLRSTRRRFLHVGAAAAIGLAALPFLPSSFTERMETIRDHRGDQSATTRLAVWAWTWDYVGEHPLGGGFDAYRGNRLQITTEQTEGAGAITATETRTEWDQGRAYHNVYFEMLGEHGWPGLILFLLIHGGGAWRMELLRRRHARDEARPWAAPLATALSHAHLVYLVGGMFVGMAFQPFVYMLVGAQIGFDRYLKRSGAKATGWGRPLRASPAAA